MSLSTQIARGTLALPLLLAFAGLGLLANDRADAAPVADPVAQVLQVEQAAALAEARAAEALPGLGRQLSRLCSTRATRSHVFVLAQAPGDLGTLAVRFNTPCRA
jgi:hypothetical protein